MWEAKDVSEARAGTWRFRLDASACSKRRQLSCSYRSLVAQASIVLQLFRLSYNSLQPQLATLAAPTPTTSSAKSKRPRPSSPTAASSSNKRPTPTPDLKDLHISPLSTDNTTGMSSANATKLYEQLKEAWSKGDGEKVKMLGGALKVSLGAISGKSEYRWTATAGGSRAGDGLQLTAGATASSGSLDPFSLAVAGLQRAEAVVEGAQVSLHITAALLPIRC